MTPPPSPVLTLHQLNHSFGSLRREHKVLADVNLTIGRGDIVTLVGPSGCGKTTLLRLIAGLEPLQQGTIHINGRLIADPTWSLLPEQRRVGFVFQDYALFPHLSVLDNVCFGLKGLDRRTRRQRVLAILDQFEIASHIDRFPHHLSGGEQQRVALVRSLITQPSILLLDEPFSGLDPTLRHQIRAQTCRLLKDHQVTCLIVTHDPDEAMMIGDRVAIMREGRLLQIGTPLELYTRPLDPFTAIFFGEVNHLQGVVTGDGVETAAGWVPLAACSCSCEHFDGERVKVMVRPEAIQLTSPEHSHLVTAEVASMRSIGRQSWIQLQMVGGHNNIQLRACMLSWSQLPTVGSKVGLTIDHRQVFVFPTHQESQGTS